MSLYLQGVIEGLKTYKCRCCLLSAEPPTIFRFYFTQVSGGSSPLGCTKSR